MSDEISRCSLKHSKLISVRSTAVPPASHPRPHPDLVNAANDSDGAYPQDSYNAVSAAAGTVKPYRDGSLNRGRGITVAAKRPPSPRAQTSGGSRQDASLDRKPSLSYGHHRNTSIVHGIQHSRNASFASPLASPLSPAIIAAAGGAGHGIDALAMSPDGSVDMSPSSIFTSHTNGSLRSMTSNSTTNGSTPSSEKASFDASINPVNTGTIQRRPERMHSSKTRRGHDHHRSQSRHPHQHTPEQKTVGEYAIHHLFNSFVAYADQKINQCVHNLGQPEPHIEIVCGAGVDPDFDQLISALGHISRQKPKPLIDTLMYWRKAKSEAAAQARAELGQVRHLIHHWSAPLIFAVERYHPSNKHSSPTPKYRAIHSFCQSRRRRSQPLSILVHSPPVGST